jgi:hypothetical protein
MLDRKGVAARTFQREADVLKGVGAHQSVCSLLDHFSTPLQCAPRSPATTAPLPHPAPLRAAAAADALPPGGGAQVGARARAGGGGRGV